VGHAFHEHGRQGGRRGLFGYVQLSLRELCSYRAAKVVLELEGGARHELCPFVLTFANGPQFGSGAVINPGATLDDGRLEIVLYDDGSRLAALAAAPLLFLGGVQRLAGYRRLTTARATVTAAGPLPLHVDGDPMPSAERLHIELRARALRVLAPGPGAEGSFTNVEREGAPAASGVRGSGRP
jgi:diacylglycerol kinase (ATP)